MRGAMNRSMLAVLLLLAACGDEGTPTVPTGTFRLVGETVNGMATPAAQLNGALELTASEVALGVAAPQPAGALGAYTLSSDGKSLVVTGGASLGVTVAGSGLSLTPLAGRTWTFAPVTPSPTDMLEVAGTVTLAAGVELSKPRVALVFYSRSEPFVNDPRDDKMLSFSAGSASFDVSRSDGARGTDRITFGATAGISIAVVVVYDDRNDSGRLDELAVCSAGTVDCVRAVSPVAIAYRDGQSAELSASQYAFLRSKWSHAVGVPDDRNGKKLGLVSSDPTITYRHAITVGADATMVTVPQFDLALP